jgi:hypothetical protein
MRTAIRFVASCAAALGALSAQAGGYTEGPDLSNNRLAPTGVPVDPGSNIVKGTMGYTGVVLDRDFFSITVAPGYLLTQLVLGPSTVVGGGASFLGMQAGGAITVDPDTVSNGSQLLGWHIYSSADIGTNILPLMGGGPDKIGFSGALPAGTYSFWVQELAPSFPGEPFPPFPYEFDLRIQAVPEPASALLMLLGGAGLLRWARPRR